MNRLKFVFREYFVCVLWVADRKVRGWNRYEKISRRNTPSIPFQAPTRKACWFLCFKTQLCAFRMILNLEK
ncbi:hypothetical protein K2173_016298 [Erythroxylum novogranatense]|uniref:Uncharacterized protein n=1 Tax=Erythroxylum novogranatense TaxID=1862640 RepID=A0AAV8SFT6_9ROSI|nr:hypothetical protein K2173_016298 [Erythroxylum novogranatense]